MLIIAGDNGSLGTTVKAPFDASRSKGTAYQTGVWVPLIVAGPLVNQGGRVVSQMVNFADFFALFAEIAGVEDVQAAVPRQIDAVSMLPYLHASGATEPADLELHRGGRQPAGERQHQRPLHRCRRLGTAMTNGRVECSGHRGGLMPIDHDSFRTCTPVYPPTSENRRFVLSGLRADNESGAGSFTRSWRSPTDSRV
jgi:hypothetical protein